MITIFYSKEIRHGFEIEKNPPSVEDVLYSGEWADVCELPGAISENDLESMFRLFNGHYGAVPNPLACAAGQDRIQRRGVHHTSMSVGDVIQSYDDERGINRFWIVGSIGFDELKSTIEAAAQ